MVCHIVRHPVHYYNNIHSRTMLTYIIIIFTVVLVPDFFGKPSKNTIMVSLQNVTQSATIRGLRRYSFWIWFVRSRRTMSLFVKFRGRWDYFAVEARALLYWPRLKTLDPSTLLSTSPPKSFRNTSLCGTRHISTTGVALNLTLRQTHVRKELHSDSLITKQIREEIRIWTIVFPQHRTSVWRPRHERHFLQAFLIVGIKSTDILYQCKLGRRRTLQVLLFSRASNGEETGRGGCCTVGSTQ